MVSYDFDYPINHVEEESEEDCEILEELAILLKQESKVIQPHQEVVEIANLGTEEEKKEAKIRVSLQDVEKRKLIELLHEYVNVFAWSYQDIPRLDKYIVVHRISLKEECSLVKQKLRRTRPDIALKIKKDVKNQFDEGFLAVAKYP